MILTDLEREKGLRLSICVAECWPIRISEALKGSILFNFWRYRVGDYRIIAHINDQTIRILVVRIGHRGNIYR